MPKKRKRGRAAGLSHEEEPKPFRVPAGEVGPGRPTDRARSGAVLIFACTVIWPPASAVLGTLLRAIDPGASASLAPAGSVVTFRVIAALVGIVLVVGAYRLTGAPGDGTISGELRAMTRLSCIAHAVVLALAVVTFFMRDPRGYGLFEGMRSWMVNVAEASLALVAARHLAQMDRRRAAVFCRWLAAAMLAAIVAGILLTRTTRDEMFNLVPSPHAYLVTPINVALWVGMLIAFGTLWLSLARRARESVPSERSGAN